MQNRVFRRLGIYLAGLLALTACHSKSGRTADASPDGMGEEYAPIEVKYARNFELDDSNPDMRLLTIRNAEGKHAAEYRYALLRQGVDESQVPEDYEVVRIPVDRFICMTSLQLSNFIALDLTDHVVGITSTRHLFNEALNEQLRNGRTVQIGIEGEFDNELVLAADPQLILVSPSKRGGFDVLKESGMPIMPHLGYQEPDPLGQAEWVKLIGVLTGHEAEATVYFDLVEQQYNELKEKIKTSQPLHFETSQKLGGENTDVDAGKSSDPHEKCLPLQGDGGSVSIFSGDMKGGAWYATGGRSFLASIFRDAGADYVLKDNEDTGGVNMDFEAIYALAADVDYWRISNSFDGEFSYDVLAQQDSRFRDFKAFRDRHVIYCNMSRTPFYESFPVHPELVLADFVKIFYPDLLPDYQPTYYKLLK